MTSEKELNEGIAAIRSAYRRERNARNVLAHMLDEKERENAKLLELLQKTWDAFHNATAREFVTVKNELRELGVEVDE